MTKNINKNQKILFDDGTSTVLAEFISKKSKKTTFQTEADLEREFIEQLQSQGYSYRTDLKTEEDLIRNLKEQIEKLNNYKFTDNEWNEFFNKYLLNKNEHIQEKTNKIQKDFIYALTCEKDGSTKNIRLLDKSNVHNNVLQVINQYESINEEKDGRKTRYDVTILVNGLPLVHIELKRRDIPIKEAFNQIKRYGRESFGNGQGLFEYIQIFVISNGRESKYYSNSTHYLTIKNNENNSTSEKTTSNSFEFTSYWSDAKNNRIFDLIDFTETFFARHTIINILTKYCVWTEDKILKVLRPYQIIAAERIFNIVKNNKDLFNSTHKGGYVWHSTGSGKTLTSFKAATLIKELSEVDKVLFVVDRKDLDYQTIKEYENFEKGCAATNATSNQLKDLLEIYEFSSKLIITTIQKLGKFIDKNHNHPIFNKNVVIIFDECHRSQFGEYNEKISKKSFKKFILFGFTGTPIFKNNSNHTKYIKEDNIKKTMTTQELFGNSIHEYTLVEAIINNNVLPFKIDYVGKTKYNEDISDELIRDIDREEAFINTKRISKIVEYILNNYSSKTKRNDKYFYHSIITNVNEIVSSKAEEAKKQKSSLNGFNSLLACQSIKAAKIYYNEFKMQQALKSESEKLKVALIYSFCPNEAEDELGDENNESAEGLDASSRDFLDDAIKDYNAMFGTTYSTNADSFNNYYKDLSLRIKNRDVDITIVVNMFLTGFDATTLNTLWLDKKLRQHSLIQAMSRTNRILNSVKQSGNIVCFLNLEEEINNAIELFTNEKNNAINIVKVRPFKEYYYGYVDEKNQKHIGFVELISNIKVLYDSIYNQPHTDKQEKEFVNNFNQFCKLENMLKLFDEYQKQGSDKVINDREKQDFTGLYLTLYDKYHTRKIMEKVSISHDLEWEIDLIKSNDINVDYILKLFNDKMATINEVKFEDISAFIDASPSLRPKRELIKKFVESININPNNQIDIFEEFREFEKAKWLDDINAAIKKYDLNKDKTINFMNKALEKGYINYEGTDLVNIMPKISILDPNRYKIKQKIYNALNEILLKHQDN